MNRFLEPQQAFKAQVMEDHPVIEKYLLTVCGIKSSAVDPKEFLQRVSAVLVNGTTSEKNQDYSISQIEDKGSSYNLTLEQAGSQFTQTIAKKDMLGVSTVASKAIKIQVKPLMTSVAEPKHSATIVREFKKIQETAAEKQHRIQKDKEFEESIKALREEAEKKETALAARLESEALEKKKQEERKAAEKEKIRVAEEKRQAAEKEKKARWEQERKERAEVTRAAEKLFAVGVEDPVKSVLQEFQQRITQYEKAVQVAKDLPNQPYKIESTLPSGCSAEELANKVRANQDIS